MYLESKDYWLERALACARAHFCNILLASVTFLPNSISIRQRKFCLETKKDS